MQKLSSFQSLKTVETFLEDLQKGITKKGVVISYSKLKIDDSSLEKCDCAFTQVDSTKEGIIYEPELKKFYFTKETPNEEISINNMDSISILDSKVASLFPKAVIEKIYSVCNNKDNQKLFLEDF